MHYGTCLLSAIPIRKSPSHKSEMVSQLLFGDTFTIIEKKDQWLYISCTYDNYEGWIDKIQAKIIEEEEFNRIKNTLTYSPLTISAKIVFKKSNISIPAFPGCCIPQDAKKGFTIAGEVFSSIENAGEEYLDTRQKIIELGKTYLEAPYLWGGKTPYGLDCSGFTQVIYKTAGCKLFRDAGQQVSQGADIGFLSDAQPADLAFFGQEEEKITHVGILLDNKKILHVSGKVRIDSIDHLGIYNAEQGKYTHRLRVVKRVI